jgi:peroxiredoxin
MKRPLTILCLLLSFSGVAIAVLGFPVAGAACCIVADLLAIAEVKAVTGKLQVSCFIIGNLCMGICLDQLHPGFPWFSIALPCISGIASTRLFFFDKVGYVNYVWYEPLMLIIGIALYVTANLKTNIGWPGWAFPAFPLLFGLYFTLGSFKDLFEFNKTKKIDYTVSTGTQVPEFCLPDHDGNDVKLSDLKGKRNLLLLFVRGDWCPSCHIMLRSYEKNRELFQQKDVFLMAIGPDPIGVNKKMVLALGLDFKILSDEKQEVVKRFGIQMQALNSKTDYESGIPMPASFLVDKSGVVRFSSRADRVGDFLNPSKIFEILPTLN